MNPRAFSRPFCHPTLLTRVCLLGKPNALESAVRRMRPEDSLVDRWVHRVDEEDWDVDLMTDNGESEEEAEGVPVSERPWPGRSYSSGCPAITFMSTVAGEDSDDSENVDFNAPVISVASPPVDTPLVVNTEVDQHPPLIGSRGEKNG